MNYPIPVVLSLVLCLFGALAVRAAPVPASTGSPREVEARLGRVMADPKAREAAVAAGKRAAFLCVHCHGQNGVSPLDYVPNLAGQNPIYLLNQIDKFGDGRRKDEFMSGLVKVLKPEDRFSMAVFYASQSVKPAARRDARREQAGRAHFARAGGGCHASQARGTREIARLAGQQPVYLRNVLKAYRQATGSRADPRMTGVARSLTDQEILALAAYLSALP
jgi:cytochrome c553